jgi:nitrite reductase/ring-hydroxylating ferredoxin subunit
MGWHVVCRRRDVPDGRGWPVRVEGRPIAIFGVGDTLYAIDNACRHNGSPLDDGFVEEGCVTCPWHGWRYELATGKQVLLFGTTKGLRTYPVSVADEMVSILVED